VQAGFAALLTPPGERVAIPFEARPVRHPAQAAGIAKPKVMVMGAGSTPPKEETEAYERRSSPAASPSSASTGPAGRGGIRHAIRGDYEKRSRR